MCITCIRNFTAPHIGAAMPVHDNTIPRTPEKRSSRLMHGSMRWTRLRNRLFCEKFICSCATSSINSPHVVLQSWFLSFMLSGDFLSYFGPIRFAMYLSIAASKSCWSCACLVVILAKSPAGLGINRLPAHSTNG